MLRPYFRFDRDLLKDLCRLAHESLLEYLRATLVPRPAGGPGSPGPPAGRLVAVLAPSTPTLLPSPP
jgi:hypothetical protein